MFSYTANNENLWFRLSSVSLSAELMIVRLLLQCLYWALILITQLGTLCGRLALVSVSQRTAYTGEKNEINQIKNKRKLLLPISPKVALGNNYPMINVYDFLARVRRINTTN